MTRAIAPSHVPPPDPTPHEPSPPAAAAPGVAEVLAAARRHDAYRRSCIGLVPTENVLSPLARQVLASDASHRYLFQNPQWRYVGGKHLATLEEAAKTLACDAFGARYANVRPLSGENCTNIVIDSLVAPGDVFYHLAMEDGGHFAARSVADRIGARRHLLPYDRARAAVDLDGCARAFADAPPDVIYLDASMVLFPHPLRRLRELAGEDTIIVYDASQVFGLILGGTFQDPLREGADVLSGSCHKSLPGPQKGMILTDRADLMERVEATIFPGHVSNFHLHHVAALAVTLAEMREFGADYARQVLANAQALAHGLARRGLAVQGGPRYTSSHQVWLDVRPQLPPDEAVERLHDAHLIGNVNLIPTLGEKGLRLGVPEITRLGLAEDEVDQLAGHLADVLTGRRGAAEVRPEVTALAERFCVPRYCYEPGAVA